MQSTWGVAGRGLPADSIQFSQAVRLPAHQIPSLDVAVNTLEAEGGALSRCYQFKRDPDRNAINRQRREAAFYSRHVDLVSIISATVNGN